MRVPKDMSLELTSTSNFLKRPMRDRDLFYESFKRLSEERVWELSKLASSEAKDVTFDSGDVYPKLNFKRDILGSDRKLASCNQIEKVYEESLAAWKLFSDKVGQLQVALGGEDEQALLEEFQSILHGFEQSELRRYEDEVVTQVYSANLNKVFELPNYLSDNAIARTVPLELELKAFHFDGFQTEASDFGIDLPNGITFDIDSGFIVTLSRQSSLFSACLDGWQVSAIFSLKVSEQFSHLGKVLRCLDESLSSSPPTFNHPAYKSYGSLGAKGYDCQGNSRSSASYHCNNSDVEDGRDLPVALPPNFPCQWIEGWESRVHKKDYEFEVSFKAE